MRLVGIAIYSLSGIQNGVYENCHFLEYTWVETILCTLCGLRRGFG